MFSPLARISRNLGRSGMTKFVRYHSEGGIPGQNLPFDINNRYKLTALFAFYFGSAFSIPFLMVRHNLLQQKQ